MYLLKQYLRGMVVWRPVFGMSWVRQQYGGDFAAVTADSFMEYLKVRISAAGSGVFVHAGLRMIV